MDNNADNLPIFLRVHSEKIAPSSKKDRKKKTADQSTEKSQLWPEYALLFDTETRTTVDQTLMFSIFRVCKLVEGKYLCDREGIVYDGRLSDKELNTIGTFVLNNVPEVETKTFPPRLKLEVYSSFPAFMERVFFPALRRGWLICGFNLPFDLSRLSLDWHRTRDGGVRAATLANVLEEISAVGPEPVPTRDFNQG